MTILSDIADVTGRLGARLQLAAKNTNNRVDNLHKQADTEMGIVRQKVVAADGFLKNTTNAFTERAKLRLDRVRHDIDAVRTKFPKL